MDLIKDVLWASDIRCRQELRMSSLAKKLNQILFSDEENKRYYQRTEAIKKLDESTKVISTWVGQTETKLVDMKNRIKMSNVTILKKCFEELKVIIIILYTL